MKYLYNYYTKTIHFFFRNYTIFQKNLKNHHLPIDNVAYFGILYCCQHEERRKKVMICTCCYKCEKRCVNCHSTCKEYLEFVKQNEIDKKKKMQEQINMYYAYENKEKIDKELRRRGIIK